MPSQGALVLFGVRLVGATPDNARKLLLSIAVVAALLCFIWIGRRIADAIGGAVGSTRLGFWSRQAASIVGAAALLLALVSIWSDDPTRLTTAAGFVTAGIAFALQRVITETAGYFVILRGKTFNVGDRIVMGGVRGDVIGLTFMQTKIMEMGQPPAEGAEDASMWGA
jgi:small-conductance mechanosensitive channel